MFACVAGRWHFVEFLPEHFDSSVETIDWLEEEDGGGVVGWGGGGGGGINMRVGRIRADNRLDEADQEGIIKEEKR